MRLYIFLNNTDEQNHLTFKWFLTYLEILREKKTRREREIIRKNKNPEVQSILRRMYSSSYNIYNSEPKSNNNRTNNFNTIEQFEIEDL